MGIFKKRQYGVINITSQEDEKDIPIVPDGTWIKILLENLINI